MVYPIIKARSKNKMNIIGVKSSKIQFVYVVFNHQHKHQLVKFYYQYVIWLNKCRYGVKPQTINQLINQYESNK